jgi:hypothetical protein
MKNALTLLLIFVSSTASADNDAQLIQDGITRQTFEKSLLDKIAGTNLVVKSYTKSWDAYNPASWIMDPGAKYRTLTFEFNDSKGKKQTITCSVRIKANSTRVFAHNCSGGEESLASYTRLYKYGYYEDALVVDGAISNPSIPPTANNPVGANR